MSFVKPDYLFLLLALPLLVVILFYSFYFLKKRLVLFSQLFSRKKFRISTWRFFLRSLLWLIAVSAIIIALAGPQWGFELVDQPSVGADIVVAIDVSNSMLATDLRPNRLELAKRKVYDLLQVLRGDRLAIVLFAGAAFVHSPLTSDHQSIQQYLNLIKPELMPLPGTAIDQALEVSAKILDSSSSSESDDRYIILISDGEEQNSAAQKAAAEIASKGYTIHALGIGTQTGAPVVNPDKSFRRDGKGQIVMTKLNPAVLRQVVDQTDGIYLEATAVGQELVTIYKQIAESSTSLQLNQDGKIKKWYNRYQYFLLLALICLFIEFLVIEYARKF